MYVKAKPMYETESHENTTVSAAILSPAICISEVTKKNGYCKAKSIKYFMNQIFLPHTVKSEPAWLTPRNSTLSQKDQTELTEWSMFRTAAETATAQHIRCCVMASRHCRNICCSGGGQQQPWSAIDLHSFFPSPHSPFRVPNKQSHFCGC